jgi:hypothetical protein
MQIFLDMPSFKVTATSVTWAYNVIEAAGLDHDTVKAALLAFAPVSNAPPGATYAWPRRGMSLDENGPGTWKATITWGSLNYQYAVKIGGQQQQIRASKQTLHKYGAAQPDCKQAIGWDGQTVHGCSIYVPQRTWTESVEIPISQYSFDYEDRVEAIQKSPVNDVAFRGRQRYAVMFMGMQAQLSTQNPDFVSASYEFTAGVNYSVANGNAITIGDITGIEKDAWDYLWVFYQPAVDPTAKAIVPSAKNVFIEVVYDSSDFAGLNIGTARALPMWQG